MSEVLSAQDAMRLEACLADGGVAVFPADTVYGVCCDPTNEQAVRRLYALKGRPAERPAAVMFFSLQEALQALVELGDSERTALEALLPAPLTLLLANRARSFVLACGPDPSTLGLRVPLLEGDLAALRSVRGPLLQSSANLSGGPDPRRLADVPASIRAGADLALDGGELPGIASTVLDLREYERSRQWTILREGPVGRAELERALGAMQQRRA